MPRGGSASSPCHPAPVPRVNPMTTTPPSASTFAAVTVFCTQRPEATPIRFTPVNSATMPAPSHGIAVAPQPVSRTRNSAAATPIAAIAAVYIPRLSTQPTTNPAREPNASRTYTYLPPALGWRVASSAKHSAPRNARPPPSTQATKVSQGRPSCAATRPGVRKIPDPSMIPATMARPSNNLSDRLRSAMGGECARKKVGAQRAAPLPVYPSTRLPVYPSTRLALTAAAVPPRSRAPSRASRPTTRKSPGPPPTCLPPPPPPSPPPPPPPRTPPPPARPTRASDEQAAAIPAPHAPERPGAIKVGVPVPVPVPVPVAREDRAIVERIVERRPAEERIVEEGIKARAEGEAGAVIRPAIPVAEADRGVVVVRISSRIRVRRLDRVTHDIVVEVSVRQHALHDVEQHLLLVVVRFPCAQHPIVPVVPAYERVELEGLHGARGEHHACALAVVHVERLAVAPPAHLDLAAAAHERVVAGIEREQHPDPAVGVGAQHHEIAVLGHLHIHACPVALHEVVVLIEPDFHGGVVTAQPGRGRARRRRSDQRDHQGENHGVLPLYTLKASDRSRSMPITARHGLESS